MITRVSGNKTGICDYLEFGKKSGREYTRDQLDKRLILEGDLDNLRKILDSQNEDKENYVHFTLSFKEENIPEKTLQEISNKFKEYLFSACHNDEFYFYAEAHLPKIKYLADKNGNYYERFPHIHVVIPKYNLLTNTRDDFLGLRKTILHYFDAFQEEINLNYNLSSPKDNRRFISGKKEDILNRYKISAETSNSDIKQIIFFLIREHKEISCVSDLAKYLQNFGEVKVRKNKKIAGGEYINLQIAGKAKAINLKDVVFLNEYLSTRDKTKLNTSEVADKYSKLTLDWRTRRAFYQRFITPSSEKKRKEFLSLSEEQQLEKLQEVFQLHCAKISKNFQFNQDKIFDNPQNLGKPKNFSDSQNFQSTETLNNGRNFNSGRDSGRRAGLASERGGNRQYLHQLPTGTNNTYRSERKQIFGRQHFLSDKSKNDVERERKEQSSSVQSFRFEGIKNTAEQIENRQKQQIFSEQINKIDLNFLLQELERRFNLDIRKIKIISDKKQGYRIFCNNKEYSVFEFLSKYLHLNWQESKAIFNEVWKQQQTNFQRKNQRVSSLLWREFKKYEFQQIGSFSKLNAEYRQQKEDLIQKYTSNHQKYSRAQKVVLSKLLERQIQAELAPIRERYWQQRQLRKLKEKERYFLFLYQKAQKANSFALWELQRLYPDDIEKKEKLLSFIPKTGEIQANKRNLLDFGYSIEIAKNGNVSYKNADGVVQIYETYSAVQVKNKDNIENIIKALEIAKLKFGTQSFVIQNAKTEDLEKIKKAAELSKSTVRMEQIIIEKGDVKNRKL